MDRHMRCLKPSVIFFSLMIPSLLSASSWNNVGVGSWNTPSNWTPTTIPNATDAEAIFPTQGAGQTISVDSDVTVGQLSFTSTAPYTINGPQTISFSKNNSISVTAGTHTITAPILLNPNALNIYNTSGNPFTISGGISGNDSIIIRSGLIVFSGTSGSNAGTTIDSGATLQVDSSTGLPASENATTVNGTLIWNLPGAGIVNMNRIGGSGIINLNDDTIIVNSGTFSGSIVGTGGLNKNSTRTLILSGASTYTGPTTINGGILDVTGSIVSSVQVNSSGTLSGTGSVGPTNNSGTVSPGNNANGTLTVNGAYTQDSTADLTIEIRDDESSSVLNVTGNITVNPGGTLTLQAQPGIYPAGSTFRFINYGGRTGSFTLIEDSSLDFSISYVDLLGFGVLINGSEGAILPVPIRSLSGNARQVADYIFCRGFLPDNLDLLSVMAALVKVPANQFTKDLVKLSPAQFGALPLTNLHSNRIIADVIVENTEKFDWCDPCVSQQDCEVNQTSVWVAPVGYYYDQHGIQEQVGFDSYAVGVGGGASHLFFNAFHVGGGVGYTYTKIDWDKDRGDGNMNSVYLGPSLGWSPKNGFLNLLVLGSYNYYDVDRKIKFPGINRTATNNHHSYDVLARLDGGYKFRLNPGGNLGHIYILPEARVSYLNIFEEGYTESGADSINLSVDSKYTAFLQPNVLVKFLRDFHTQNWCIMPAFQVGWISNIWLSSSNYKSRFYKQEVCQPNFVVKSYSRNTNQISLGLDVNFRRMNDWIIDVGYRVDFLDDNYIMDGKIKIEKRF